MLELDRLVVQVHLARHGIKPVGLEVQAHGGDVGVGAAHQGGDAGHELLHAQGLDHEVVGPGMEGGDDVLFLVALAGKQDGQLAAARFAQGAHHVNATQAREQPVDDQQVKAFATHGAQQIFARLKQDGGMTHLVNRGLHQP